MSLVVSLSRFLTFSAVKFFSEFISIHLFLLINLQNLLLRKYLAEFIVILFTNIQHFTTLSKLVPQHGCNLVVSHGRTFFLSISVCALCFSFLCSRLMSHHTTFTQFFQILLVYRSKLSCRCIIQHQCINYLFSLHLHHLFWCRTLFFLFIICILCRQSHLASHQENGHNYINKFSLHNLHV